jgi:hypothetical protein
MEAKKLKNDRMKKLIMVVGAVVFAVGSLFAQDNNEAEALIQYDPLFWKDELKLDNDQCQKIREINGEYYESLFTAYRKEKDDRKALRQLADKSLIHRNQEIWDTFDSKQRKRWKRIWQASIASDSRNES